MRDGAFRHVDRIFGPDEVFIADEVARRVSESVIRTEPAKRLATRIIDKKDWPVKTRMNVMEEKRPGRLREFALRSPTTAFSIILQVDDNPLIDRTYAELAASSPEMDIIGAYESDSPNAYIATITDLFWSKSVLIAVAVTTPTTFQNIFAVYEVEESINSLQGT
ncbi:MAG: hypothetical protein PHZ19_07625 [Candidatus Thermoplasmatota archaeon]|jgi:hypothetical protein|nr:hypothetical protein [Candidatus Thermoplasmatota archaeon]